MTIEKWWRSKKFDDDRKKIIIGKLDDGKKNDKNIEAKNDQAKNVFTVDLFGTFCKKHSARSLCNNTYEKKQKRFMKTLCESDSLKYFAKTICEKACV